LSEARFHGDGLEGGQLARVGVAALVVLQHGDAARGEAEREIAERFVGAEAFIAVVRPRPVHEHDGRTARAIGRRRQRSGQRRWKVADGHLALVKQAHVGIGRHGVPGLHEQTRDASCTVEDDEEVEVGPLEATCHEGALVCAQPVPTCAIALLEGPAAAGE
jgi:hypothetical protein